MGHISSLWSARGDTAMVVLFIIVSWGLRCSSYKLRSRFMATTTPGREKIEDVAIERELKFSDLCSVRYTKPVSTSPTTPLTLPSASNANGYIHNIKIMINMAVHW